jgi:hypothetical protein
MRRGCWTRHWLAFDATLDLSLAVGADAESAHGCELGFGQRTPTNVEEVFRPVRFFLQDDFSRPGRPRRRKLRQSATSGLLHARRSGEPRRSSSAIAADASNVPPMTTVSPRETHDSTKFTRMHIHVRPTVRRCTNNTVGERLEQLVGRET